MNHPTAQDMLRSRSGRRALALIVGAALAVLLAGAAAYGAERRDNGEVAETVYQVNVNDADAEQLQLLWRVGPVLAQRIIEEREHGEYIDLLDLQERVRGIGPRTIACNADFIAFSGPTDLETKVSCEKENP